MKIGERIADVFGKIFDKRKNNPKGAQKPKNPSTDPNPTNPNPENPQTNPTDTSKQGEEGSEENIFVFFQKLLEQKIQEISKGGEQVDKIQALEAIKKDCEEKYEKISSTLEELQLFLEEEKGEKEKIETQIEENAKHLRKVTAVLLLAVRELQKEGANQTKINNTLHLVVRCYRTLGEYTKATNTSKEIINATQYKQAPTTKESAQEMLKQKDEVSMNINIINGFGNMGICHYLQYEKENKQEDLLKSIIYLYIATNMPRGIKKKENEDVKKRIKTGDSVYEEYLGTTLLLLAGYKENLSDDKIKKAIQETLHIVQDEEKRNAIIKDIVLLTGGNEENVTQTFTENVVNFIQQQTKPEKAKAYVLKSLKTVGTIIEKYEKGERKKPVIFHFPVMIKLLEEMKAYFTQEEKEEIKKHSEKIIEFFGKIEAKKQLVEIFKKAVEQL